MALESTEQKQGEVRVIRIPCPMQLPTRLRVTGNDTTKFIEYIINSDRKKANHLKRSEILLLREDEILSAPSRGRVRGRMSIYRVRLWRSHGTYVLKE